MAVALQGPSPAALTAGILLLSRSRSLGLPLEVKIVGDPSDVAAMTGPTMLYSPVLASCGVTRDRGAGPLVVVPGPSTEPLAVTLTADGTDGWFTLDRAGTGVHPSTAAFVHLCRDRRAAARHLALQLRRAVASLGCTPEPALFDLLFGAPVAPLERLAVALRAGRVLAGGSGSPITRFLETSIDALPDPLPEPCTPASLADAAKDGRLDALLARLAPPSTRVGVEDWVGEVQRLASEDGGEPGPYGALVCSLADVAGPLLSLPPRGMLPPLSPAADSVAVGLGAGLGATAGTTDASRGLVETFRFLGGRFVEEARYAVVLDGTPPPADRLERWAWFCRSARRAADTADVLWRRVIDLVQ